MVSINAPISFFESPHAELHDDQFQAWREVPATGQLNGYTLYGGHQLVFTRGDRLPWVPVTAAEYVDFTLRDLQRRAQEEAQARGSLPAASDTAARKAELRSARRKATAGFDANPVQTMIRRVQAWRASLSPQQLAAPALLGLNGLHDSSVPLDRYPRLVKPDPNFPWDRQHPARPQMLKVSVRGGGDFEQPMQRVLQHPDLKALQALVD